MSGPFLHPAEKLYREFERGLEAINYPSISSPEEIYRITGMLDALRDHVWPELQPLVKDAEEREREKEPALIWRRIADAMLKARLHEGTP